MADEQNVVWWSKRAGGIRRYNPCSRGVTLNRYCSTQKIIPKGTETEQRAITVGTILQALRRKVSVNTKLEKDVAYLPGYIETQTLPSSLLKHFPLTHASTLLNLRETLKFSHPSNMVQAVSRSPWHTFTRWYLVGLAISSALVST